MVLVRLAFLATFKTPPTLTFQALDEMCKHVNQMFFSCFRRTEHKPLSQCVEISGWLYIPHGSQPFWETFSWRSIFAELPLPPSTPLCSSASLSLWQNTKEPLSLGYWLVWQQLTVPPHLHIPKFWSKWVRKHPILLALVHLSANKLELEILTLCSTMGSSRVDSQPKLDFVLKMREIFLLILTC